MVDGHRMAATDRAPSLAEEEQKRDPELVLIQRHLEVETHAVDQAHKLHLVTQMFAAPSMEAILIGDNGALAVIAVKMVLSKLENVTVQPQHVEEMIANQP